MMNKWLVAGATLYLILWPFLGAAAWGALRRTREPELDGDVGDVPTWWLWACLLLGPLVFAVTCVIMELYLPYMEWRIRKRVNKLFGGNDEKR